MISLFPEEMRNDKFFHVIFLRMYFYYCTVSANDKYLSEWSLLYIVSGSILRKVNLIHLFSQICKNLHMIQQLAYRVYYPSSLGKNMKILWLNKGTVNCISHFSLIYYRSDSLSSVMIAESKWCWNGCSSPAFKPALLLQRGENRWEEEAKCRRVWVLSVHIFLLTLL